MKKTVLITGASKGIGAATAIKAAMEGYAVAVNYHQNKPAAENVIKQIVNFGGVARSFHADITDEESVIAMFHDIIHYYGGVDVLVNNAGTLESQMQFNSMSIERIRRVFNTNVFGQMICAREAVKHMNIINGGRGGSIVNVSSIAAKTGSPNEYVDYAASKGAIDTFTIGLAKEVADIGIRVNAVRPAFIHTEIHTSGGDPDRIDRLKSTIPLKRGGTVEEVAEAIMWLASEKSSYCTGAFIDITGGK